MERRQRLVEKTYVPRAAVALFFQYCKEATRNLQDIEEEAGARPPERPRLH